MPGKDLGAQLEPEPEPSDGAPAAKPKLVVVVGGPGSGKKTSCKRLVDELHDEYGVVNFSIGDLLRNAIVEGHADSEEIERAMIKGEPVRDAIVMKVMLEAIDPNHAPEGRCIVLDGLPGSVEQAQLLEETIGKPDAVLIFMCPEDVMIERVLSRGIAGGRKDDQNMSVLSRMARYNRFIADLMDRYSSLIKYVDASGGVDEAYDEFNRAFRTIKAVQTTRANRKRMKSQSRVFRSEKDVRALWDEIDEDRSGSLEMAEVQRLSHRLHLPLTHLELVDAMKKMDADGSGGK